MFQFSKEIHFIRAFERTIVLRTDDDSDKLYYLLQHTAGDPTLLASNTMSCFNAN